jgi:spore germination protein GerM
VTRRTLAVLGLVGLVLTACGVPLDSGPRDIPRESQRPLGEAESPGGPGGSAFGPRVYFLRDDPDTEASTLVPLSRDVQSSPEAVLGALFEGLTTAEQAARLRTSIPSGAALNGARVIAARTLQVDVSEELLQTTGESQIEAVAQIVYTSTALPGVDRVRLLVDGEPREWLVGSGAVAAQTLTRFMYPGFASSSRPAFPPIPSPEAAT